MSEEHVGAADVGGRPVTGIVDLDRVLDLISGLDHHPLDEHGAVFSAAHDELRRALDPGTALAPTQT